VLPEHVQITSTALSKIEQDDVPPAWRAMLREVEQTMELCKLDPRSPRCVSLAALPAIAGDHACSPVQLRPDMDRRASRPRWMGDVMAVSWSTAKALDECGDDGEARALRRRKMHIELQEKDAKYVSRATLDFSHFQLSRESGPLDLEAYLRFALAPAQQANATATYANFHLVALRLADEMRHATDDRVRADRLVRATIAEAFALHFLEDSFSTGHFTGHWGSQSMRLGSHDAYSTEGAEAIPWSAIDGSRRSVPYRAHGDAFLGAVDLEHVSGAVRKSIEQLLEVSTDAAKAKERLAGTEAAFGSEAYDTCNEPLIPPALVTLATWRSLQEVLAEEPVPSPREPPLPRVRAEKGAFIGAAAAFEGAYGALREPGDEAAVSRFRASVRLGFGADAIAADAMNAIAFFDFGYAGAYVDVFEDTARSITGWSVRLRAPGMFVNLDGVLAIALAETTRSPAALAWASTAGSGGLGGFWRSQLLFSGITGQISALRDVTFGTYIESGYWRREILAPVLSARKGFDMKGEAPGQATDLWLDLGGSATWSSQHRAMSPGLFISFSVASRLFPAGVLD
jgi:hypothetical protein